MNTQRAFVAALRDPLKPCPPGLTSWNGSNPGKRFDVYRNNVVTSLVDALADTFAVLQALVGEEFFRAMARAFVLSSPPTSPILARYGEGFANFVQNFAPAQSLAYLADMARLEMARVRAYHAADAEPISQHALAVAMAQTQRVPQLQVGLHPSLQLLRSRFAVVSLWAAHQGEQEIAAVQPLVPEDALVVRSAMEVHVVLLRAGAAALVQGLQDGLPLGQAAAQALAPAPDFDLSQSLALLLRLGAITTLE